MATPRSRRSTGKKKKPSERVGLGGGSIDKHLSRPKKKKSNVFARIGDGNTITVRAIDTKKFFKDGEIHPVRFERKDGSSYTMDVRCLDPEDEGDPCPGCRDDLDRRFKFWMLVIVRDAPKENKSGKVIGEEDQVRILSGANRLVKQLNAKHKRHPLDKRDIEITQLGEGTDVAYEIEWADDEDNDLSKEDRELVEEADEVIESFEFYTSLRDEDDFYEPPSSKNDDDDDDDPGERSRRRGSAFSRTRKSVSKSRRDEDEDDDDDDDDDEDDRPARRSSKKKGGAFSAAKKKSTTKAKAKSKPAIKSRKR